MNTEPFTPEAWLHSPREAFMAWVLSDDFAITKNGEKKPMGASSITVYRSMFGKFVTQTLEQSPARRIDEVTSTTIEEFLKRNELQGSILNRYIRLLERVYDRLQELGLMKNNPAREVVRPKPAKIEEESATADWLTSQEMEALLQALPAGDDIRTQRNRALIATLIGAGLRTGEVIALTMQDVGKRDGQGAFQLDIRPLGTRRFHKTRVLPGSSDILSDWIETLSQYRFNHGMAGDLLFPSLETDEKLHPATVYRMVASVFDAANIPHERIKRRGARTLRNTFALQALAEGSDLKLIGEYLGHHDERSTRYYKSKVAKLKASQDD